MFSAAELADLAALWESALDTTCTVYTRTDATDNAGGSTVTETANGPYACRVQPAQSAQRAMIAGGVVEYDVYSIMLPADATVTSNARIVAADGKAYEVRGVDVGRSYRYGLQALCVRSGA